MGGSRAVNEGWVGVVVCFGIKMCKIYDATLKNFMKMTRRKRHFH